MRQIRLPWMLRECIEIMLPLTIRFLRSGCCLYDIPSLILLRKANLPVHFTPVVAPQHKKKSHFGMRSVSSAFLSPHSFAPSKQCLAWESTLLRAVKSCF